MRSYLRIAAVILSLSIAASRLQAAVIFVNINSTAATPNGSSWALAFPSLQQALATATAGTQIWVAQGSYLPTAGGDATISFQMANGVSVYGGFTGVETTLAQRNAATNITTLSGNIGGTGINSLHVVSVPATVAAGALDGFTVVGGNAAGAAPDDQGGGILVQTPAIFTISHCTFSGNAATTSGGGFQNIGTSNVTVTNCTFTGNSGGNAGGAGTQGTTNFTQCVFINNTADAGGNSHGGGIDNVGAITLLDCAFEGNTAQFGGGMRNFQGVATLTNCIFYNNTAVSSGGGFRQHNTKGGIATLTNCTFSLNSCSGGGSTGGAISLFSGSALTAVNCILFNDLAASLSEIDDPNQNLTFCDVLGGYAGVGNINADPSFVNDENAIGPDNLYGTADDGLRLAPGSLCIDAGTNVAVATDFTGVVPRKIGAGVDMGAYETALVPIITAAASATSPATASVQAVDPNVPPLGPLTYTWSAATGPGSVMFAPNGTAASNTTTMIFTAPGAYQIQVDVSNGSQDATSTVFVVVTGPPFSIAPPDDSDGDGFPDELEKALGTDPFNAASTPFGGQSAGAKNPVQVVNITSMTIKLAFNSAGRDSIAIKGTIPVPMTFPSIGQKVGLVVGGIVRNFALTSNGTVYVSAPFTNGPGGQIVFGTGPSLAGGKNSIKIMMKNKPGKTMVRTATFNVKLSNGSDFKSNLASRGLKADKNYVNSDVIVRTFILLYNTTLYDTQKVLAWNAKKSKTGTAKPGSR